MDGASNRLDYIDIAKGIGICLVVLGHTTILETGGIGKYVHDFVYLFHMPLFFLISGFLYHHKEDMPVKEYLKGKFHTLGVPFLIFWIVPCIYRVAFKGESAICFFRWMWQEQFDCWAIWFLYTLIIVSVLYKYFYRRIRKISIWGFLIVGLIIFTFRIFHFYLLIDTALFGMIYYHIGHLYQHSKVDFKKSLTGIICLFLMMVAKNSRDYLSYSSINYRGFWFGNNDFVSTIVFALIGSLCVVWISQYLVEKNFIRKLLSNLGKNSIVIVCTHVQIMYLVDFLFPSLRWGGKFLAIVILYSCGLLHVLRRYFFFLFGLKCKSNKK